ncbi:MAG TPA: NADH/ubiquinone/plastoquinone (complex I) [bacterium]|nr:NADH/ubiquinone/plastoquinone (complex I) [bacterium]
MNFIPLFVIVPLGAAFLMPVVSRLWKGMSDVLGNLAALFLMVWSFAALQMGHETTVFYAGGWEPVASIPIGIAMVMDGLTVFMLIIINVIGFAVTLYSVNYMNHYTDKAKYYTLFLLMMAGLNGVVLAGDLFNLFVFLEISAIASYSLVAFGIGSEELEASFKYQILGGTASTLILMGIAFFYHMTGTLNLADASTVIQQLGTHPGIIFVSILFLVGFSLKAALIPFHAWLPDAHPSAPAPISAMLSGVVIKVLGVYALIRIFFNVFGITAMPSVLTIFIVLGSVSMVAGAFLAISQSDFKRMLAYSSISQIGYVLFALGLGTPLGILGAMFHLINHAAFKSLLFLNSGAVVYRTNTRDLDQLGGISQKMPVTGITSLLGSLSISGLPPFGGFWSKLIIIMAAVESGHFALAGVAVFTSIVTLAYYMKLQKEAFYGALKASFGKLKEAPFLMSLSVILLAIVVTGMGLLLIPEFKSVILDPAVKIISGGLNYSKLVLGG